MVGRPSVVVQDLDMEQGQMRSSGGQGDTGRGRGVATSHTGRRSARTNNTMTIRQLYLLCLLIKLHKNVRMVNLLRMILLKFQVVYAMPTNHNINLSLLSGVINRFLWVICKQRIITTWKYPIEQTAYLIIGTIWWECE